MPIYEYRCGQGHNFERMEGFDAPRERACPRCGGRARRLLSLPAVIFKGPGFYSTDNRSDGRASARGDGQKGEEPVGGKESSEKPSPETKSEAPV